MMDGMMGGGGGLGYGYMLLGLVFWILIIVGIILLIKWLVGQGKSEVPGQMTAMETLKNRYVKGEITAEEFEEMKKRLQ